nr:unnamed protein product [Naegleria fowleri]
MTVSDRPERTHKLPCYLEDYIVGDFDLRKNYEKEIKKREAQKKKKKTLTTTSSSTRSFSSSSSSITTSSSSLKAKSTSTEKTTAKRREKAKLDTKKKKDSIKKSIRSSKSSSSSFFSSTSTAFTSSVVVTPYNDFKNPKYKVYTSPSEAKTKLLEKTPGNKMFSGREDATKWAISSLANTNNSRYGGLSINDLLTGCYYVPGNNHKLQSDSDHVPPVQICFSFDTTGSMYSYLDNLKFKLQTICQQLMNDIRGLEIAVICHGDYQDARGKYAISKLDFTTDIEQITSFVQSVERTSGYDTDECYEAVLKEAQAMSWVPVENTYTIRSLVVIGDASPHKPSEWFGIDWKEEAKKLFDDYHIKVHSVKCGNMFGSQEFYQTIASETGGSVYHLDNFEKTVEMFCGLIYREATEHNMMDPTMQAHINNAASGEVTLVKPTAVAPSSSSMDAMVDDDTVTPRSDDATSLGGYVVTDADILKIHNAIHSRDSTVTINGMTFGIQMNDSSCRYVRVDGVVYIEQNKEKKTKYAKMALEGKKITWICHSGNWGLIVDDSIQKR